MTATADVGSSVEPTPQRRCRMRWYPAGVFLAATTLTLVFWGPLWKGGGFVGGDVYSYYLPQKTLYADLLAAGELPLWNPLTGLGYPVLGESQTGVFYPPHLVMYRLFDINTAYHASHLLHYIMAFCFAVAWIRRLGMSRIASLLGALVYVYSWFPSRNCWEWAILGGAWLPAILWATERWFQGQQRRDVVLLSLFVAVQLLGGHFNLSFITLLFVSGYALIRTQMFPGVSVLRDAGPEFDLGDGGTGSRMPGKLSPRRLVILAAAIAAGVGLAAIQLVPTWQLKQHSQRQVAGEFHRLEFGQIPVQSWSQLTGWVRTEESGWHRWHHPATQRDQELRGWNAHTNQVEAHLYVGLLPLAALLGVVGLSLTQRRWTWLFWPLTAVVSLLYSTGWLVDVLGLLPGFGYFQGPGRFTVLFSLAAGVATAICWDAAAQPVHRVLRRGLDSVLLLSVTASVLLVLDSLQLYREIGIPSPFDSGLGIPPTGFWLTLLAVIWSTTIVRMIRPLFQRMPAAPGRVRTRAILWSVCLIVDFWSVGRLVTYSPMVADPPISHRDESPIRQQFGSRIPRPRWLAPGGNLVALAGINTVPAYLTFGPAQYVEELSWVAGLEIENLNPEDISRLDSIGVSHVMSLTPLDEGSGRLEPVWSGQDQMLNRALNQVHQPLYVYQIRSAVGRLTSTPIQTELANHRDVVVPEYRIEAEWRKDSANEIEVAVDLPKDSHLRLKDLPFPGWQVSIDGEWGDANSDRRIDRETRVSAGQHLISWKYSPPALYWGVGISLAAAILLVLLAWMHPNAVQR